MRLSTTWRICERASGPVEAAQLVDKLVAAKERDGLSIRHVQDLRLWSRILLGTQYEWSRWPRSQPRSGDEWLRSLPPAPVTRNHYRRVWSCWRSTSLLGKDERPTIQQPRRSRSARVPKTKPGILTVEQATARSPTRCAGGPALHRHRNCLPVCRRAEIERLDWSEIDFESGHIEVTRGKVEVQAGKPLHHVAALLTGMADAAVRKLRGHVTPQESFVFRDLFDQTRARPLASCRSGRTTRCVTHSPAITSRTSRMRRLLLLEMGHIDSPGMLFNHYRALVKPKEAERYWHIKPAEMAKVIPMPHKRTDGSQKRRVPVGVACASR